MEYPKGKKAWLLLPGSPVVYTVDTLDKADIVFCKGWILKCTVTVHFLELNFLIPRTESHALPNSLVRDCRWSSLKVYVLVSSAVPNLVKAHIWCERTVMELMNGCLYVGWCWNVIDGCTGQTGEWRPGLNEHGWMAPTELHWSQHA